MDVEMVDDELAKQRFPDNLDLTVAPVGQLATAWLEVLLGTMKNPYGPYYLEDETHQEFVKRYLELGFASNVLLGSELFLHGPKKAFSWLCSANADYAPQAIVDLCKPFNRELDFPFPQSVHVVLSLAAEQATDPKSSISSPINEDGAVREGAKALLNLGREIEFTRSAYQIDFSYPMFQRSRPLFVVLHVPEVNHYVLLGTMDGKKWYFHDSMNLDCWIFALHWLQTLYKKLGYPENTLDLCVLDPANCELDADPATAAAHQSFLQDNGIDCALHCFERIDYFCSTLFRRWPCVTPELPVFMRQKTIAHMRAALVDIHSEIVSLNTT